MTKHDAEPGTLRFGAGKSAVGPGDLLWGDVGGGGVPGEVEDVVLLEAVVEGEAVGFDESEVGVGLVAVPVFFAFLAINDIDKFAVVLIAGGVVVANGEGKGKTGAADGGENFFVEGVPHGCDFAAREGELLTCDHVAAAEDDVGLPFGQEADAGDDFGAVVGGAVGAVEVADDGEADVAAWGGG